MSDMQIRMEGEVCKAVQNVGINVDKEELLKALQYDKDQYEKGYADRDSEIVRCKDCKFYDGEECLIKAGWFHTKPDWFCADGAKKE
jgi:hypothetical protein